MMSTIRYAILVYPDFPMLAFSALIEPLRAANLISGQSLYSWRAVAPDAGPEGQVVASNGFSMSQVGGLDDPADHATPADRIIICSGGDADRVPVPVVGRWLRQAARRGAHIGAVADGAFLLARTGLLDGYRCTLHWTVQQAFSETFPKVALDRSTHVIDRDRFTALGGVGALDLMIEVIGNDHGPRLAQEIADWFIHSTLRAKTDRNPLPPHLRTGLRDGLVLDAVALMDQAITDQTGGDMPRVADIAAGLGVSVRGLERAFLAETGIGPGAYLRNHRLDRAQDLLLHSGLPLREIAVSVGYGDMSAFGRAIQRRFGLAPAALRRQRRGDDRRRN